MTHLLHIKEKHGFYRAEQDQALKGNCLLHMKHSHKTKSRFRRRSISPSLEQKTKSSFCPALECLVIFWNTSKQALHQKSEGHNNKTISKYNQSPTEHTVEQKNHRGGHTLLKYKEKPPIIGFTAIMTTT